jgi:hypothetical protein
LKETFRKPTGACAEVTPGLYSGKRSARLNKAWPLGDHNRRQACRDQIAGGDRQERAPARRVGAQGDSIGLTPVHKLAPTLRVGVNDHGKRAAFPARFEGLAQPGSRNRDSAQHSPG